MLRQKIALILSLCLLVTGTLLAPVASASDYYSARTPLSGSQAKHNNIDLAVQAITGTTVPYGGTFSFNQTVGARTEARGYQSAPNGRGVVVTGGGVAQVATTLYLTLLKLRGTVEFGTIQTYGANFVDNYVSDSSQAIVTDYNADIDLSFTNYTADMTIEMWASADYVYCSITVGGDAAPSTGGGAGTGGADSWFAFTSPTAAPSLPTRQLIATANLYCGDEDNVINNVQLAADSMTDSTLNSGDTFSFNDVVGPRLKKYGYKRATNGRGARIVGGGVAQVATVVWLAVKNMNDIAIVEKSTYGSRYTQNYVESSSDAILTDYDSGRDFSFKYTGAGSITVYTYLDGHRLYCDIYRN